MTVDANLHSGHQPVEVLGVRYCVESIAAQDLDGDSRFLLGRDATFRRHDDFLKLGSIVSGRLIRSVGGGAVCAALDTAVPPLRAARSNVKAVTARDLFMDALPQRPE